MQEFLTVGVITKPQGIKGEVKVRPLTDDPARFKKIKEVFIDGKSVKLISARVANDAVLLLLDGIYDRNSAEFLRGKEIMIRRENAVELDPGTFFIVDILDCDVITDGGEFVGKVIDVTPAKTDIFTVLCKDGKLMRFPFLKDLIQSVDLEKKQITMYKKRLEEVSVYED